MARLTPLGEDDVEDAARVTLDVMLAERGWVPNLYRTLARSPGLLDAFVEMTAALKVRTTLPARLRELAILVVARELDARIQWAAHVPLALAAGLTAESIAAVESCEQHLLAFDALSVHNFALELTRRSEPESSTWHGLEAFLDERQLVELTLTVGFYNMVARFLRTADLEVDREYHQPPPVPPR